MVARKARWSRVRLLGWASKPRSSRDDMAAKSWVGLAWRLHRVRGVCGCAPQNRQVPWLSHKAKTGGSACGDGIWVHRETSKRRTHIEIARLASRLSGVQSPDIRLMVLRQEFPKCPLWVCILLSCNRGSFVFQLPPYELRGERMAATTWNPNSFASYFSLSLRFSLG
jgi:hypothetical protein